MPIVTTLFLLSLALGGCAAWTGLVEPLRAGAALHARENRIATWSLAAAAVVMFAAMLIAAAYASLLVPSTDLPLNPL